MVTQQMMITQAQVIVTQETTTQETTTQEIITVTQETAIQETLEFYTSITNLIKAITKLFKISLTKNIIMKIIKKYILIIIIIILINMYKIFLLKLKAVRK